MSTSSKIPATDRSAGGPGSSHVNRDAPKDSAGAHHQNQHEEHKHPRPEEQNSTGGGTKHEKRHPGEGGRS